MYGLAPFFPHKLTDEVQCAKHIVVLELFILRPFTAYLLLGLQQGLGDELYKIVQVSMERPIQKLKHLRRIQKYWIWDLVDAMLFMLGVKMTAWYVVQFLKAMYSVFKDLPTRRSDFRQITGCSVLPTKFCDCRWLQNVPVCETTQIFPYLKFFFHVIQGLPLSKLKIGFAAKHELSVADMNELQKHSY
ncbi:hypothetical protein PR048_021598 [Dryococelus australis]|uniref:Uncharacterized protein n=1 Tax=Dryococelus australis TaxID=614101 RepID=A0ABQ9GYP3_9NEOP|nr:hypothetical protein PR048_021598 [Dryococelus australis]